MGQGPGLFFLSAPENDFGFFYSPEAVEDLHNADQWGGKNDILLSSYLHFKNLPDILPEWLLRTAMVWSNFEQKIIKKFEEKSFLPMILEFSKGLFRAKWKIRKVFGEDIFPGTLLLVRLGYMEVTAIGKDVLTSKYTDR